MVEHALENYPDTRDSDTRLYIKCCEIKGAKTLEDLKDINLNIISVHKLRQKIQNNEGKYLPSSKIQQIRDQRAIEIKEYMLNQ